MSLAPVEPEHWEPAVMEAGSVSSASMEPSDKEGPQSAKEEVGATPQDGFSMGSVTSPLQQASEETPDPAGPPDNPACKPFRVRNPGRDVEQPHQPGHGRYLRGAPPGTFPGASHGRGSGLHTSSGKAEEAKGTSRDDPSGQDFGLLEVECREALRAQWLSFPFQPGETAESTLAHCRTAAAMASLDYGLRDSLRVERKSVSFFVCPRSVLNEIDRLFYLNKHRHEPWHVCDMALACLACFELAMMSASHGDVPETSVKRCVLL